MQGIIMKKLLAVWMITIALFLPAMSGQAFADTAVACIDSADCGAGSTCVGGACTPVPEMSDYLAMAFLIVAGGMIYYIRRRELASA